MPASARAFWTRLYAEIPTQGLPWANTGPFPPLVRAVENGWLSTPGPVLDVGCGVGTNTLWLASQGFQATGIDIAPGAVAAAVSNRGATLRNPNFLEDDVLVSSLPTAKFRSAVDVGCFQTLPPRTRRAFSAGLARLLSPGAPYLLFWVAREETGPWGPPHRLSVGEVVDTFESLFLVEQVEYRPRTVRLTRQLMRSARPLATLSGYTARLVRRRAPQPPAK
ncbi:MAG: class I SAM-dependent methyltransferase [Thermoplasmata archaeon]